MLCLARPITVHNKPCIICQISHSTFPVLCNYCQTFENRSSLPPSPPGGFGGAADLEGAELQLPKSSSALTFAGLAELAGANPPAPPGIMLWFASEPESHPKLLLLLFCTGSTTWLTAEFGGSGAPHALLDPHGSGVTQAFDVEID